MTNPYTAPWIEWLQMGLNHRSMDLDAAPLPLLYNSWHEYQKKKNIQLNLCLTSAHIYCTANYQLQCTFNASLNHVSCMQTKQTLQAHSSCSSQGGLNHWSMDIDAAPLPLLYNSRHEQWRKNINTIKLMPNFSTHILFAITVEGGPRN